MRYIALLLAMLLPSTSFAVSNIVNIGGGGGGSGGSGGTNTPNFSNVVDDIGCIGLAFPRRAAGDGGWDCATGAVGGDALKVDGLVQFASSLSADLRTVLSDESGTGIAYFQGGNLGTPSGGVLTSATGLPISTGVAGLGTGVAAALATNVGAAGAPVLLNGLGGTPASIVLTNATGIAANLTCGVALIGPDLNGDVTSILGATNISDNAVDGTDIALVNQSGADVMCYDGTNWTVDCTFSECFPLYAPTAEILNSYDIQSVWRAPAALTITEVWCETNTGTVTMDLNIDDDSPAQVLGTDLVCAATAVSDSAGLAGTMAAGDRLDFDIANVSSNPTRLTVCIKYQF